MTGLTEAEDAKRAKRTRVRERPMPSTLQLFPMAASDAVYAVWIERIGAHPYPVLRKCLTPLFTHGLLDADDLEPLLLAIRIYGTVVQDRTWGVPSPQDFAQRWAALAQVVDRYPVDPASAMEQAYRALGVRR